MKRITVINQDSGYLMVDLANAISGPDRQVTLITGRLVVREKPLSGGVETERIIKYNRSSKISRLFTWVTGFLQILFLVNTRHRKDYLLIVSNPPFATLLPLFCKNRFSCLIFDVYPDALVQTGISTERTIIVKTWAKANRKIFSRADHVFTLTQTMAGLLKRYCGEHPVSVIPVWSNNEFFKPVPKGINPFVHEHNLSGRFIVLYSGNLGATHDVAIVPRIARVIKNPDILFLIIGEGDQKESIYEDIKRLQLNNCQMLPLQPVEVIPYSFAAADIAIVSIGKNASSLSLPSKTFNFMSAGLPLLCISDEDSELSRLVGNYNNGRCFNHTRIDDMVSFITETSDNPGILSMYRENSLKASKDFTSENAGIIADAVIEAASR